MNFLYWTQLAVLFEYGLRNIVCAAFYAIFKFDIHQALNVFVIHVNLFRVPCPCSFSAVFLGTHLFACLCL